MTKTRNSAGYSPYGVAGPNGDPISIPAAYAVVRCNQNAIAVGEPVYCSIGASVQAAPNNVTVDGDALLYDQWIRNAPTSVHLHTGFVGICKEVIEVVGTDAIIRIQTQGICTGVTTNGSQTDQIGMTFKTTGSLQPAVAGDAVVAIAMGADVGTVGTVLLLGSMRGLLGALV